MILVIGGRSKIGAALIDELLARGQQVRALVRAGEPARGLAAAVEIVTGDLADEGSLVAALPIRRPSAASTRISSPADGSFFLTLPSHGVMPSSTWPTPTTRLDAA